MLVQLPPSREDQSYFTITPLHGGSLELPEEFVVSDVTPGKRLPIPSLAFLLRHSSSKINILFDLGIKRDLAQYSPSVQNSMKKHFGPVSGNPDVLESLQNSGTGISPTDITHIILSHIHWDHIGDHQPFSNAKVIVGAAAKPLLQTGYPYDSASSYLRSTVPDDRAIWLNYDNWGPIGPFERSHDFFGDGSLFVIDAAGHLTGHINVLVRTSPDGAWAYLAADSAHDVRLITGEKQLGSFVGEDGSEASLHEDPEKAKDHIRRITHLPENVKVWLAHDPSWKEKI